jgi:hypothetical protein
MSSPFVTPVQALQFYDKYSRYDNNLGRRETWPESVDRVMNFFLQQATKRGKTLPDETWDRLSTSMLRLEAMPSMRIVQMAGPALERCNVGAYNCAYLPIDSWDAYGELLYVLMQGTGCGFSVEVEYVSDLPKIKRQKGEKPERYIVPDTTIGWCDALTKGLKAWAGGDDITYDFSRIRPQGTVLKTKGGRASGPEPLKRLLAFAREKLLARQGRRLTTVEAHDIACYCGDIVQVGGVRRAAEISLSDLDDREMRDAKAGQFWLHNVQRAMANNSAVYDERPSSSVFMEEWLALMKSGTGERGIFNRGGVIKHLPKRRKRRSDFGVNPCVTGDTVIMTLDGPRTFNSLADAGEDVMVYAWHPMSKLPVVRWMRRPHKTQVQAQLLEVGFDSGLKVRCTYNHGFYSFRGTKVEAQDLQVGQSIRAWSMSQHRDGHLRVHGWDTANNRAAHQWVGRMVYECAFGPIPIGKIVHHKNEIKTDNDPSNLEAITAVEHNEFHYPARFEAGFDGTAPNHKVVSIQQAGYGDVYNGCVDDAHSYIILDPTAVAGMASGIVSANCGEIILRPRQFCNLSIAVARPDDTELTLQHKVETAAIFGTLQSLLTDFDYLPEEWKKNCEEERLLGVDITGQMDCPLLQPYLGVPTNANRPGTREELLSRLRDAAIETNLDLAKTWDIQRSASVTCIKPSGNSAQLFNCSSGLHPRYAKHYVRRLRIGAYTPIAKLLKDSGVPWQPEVGQTKEDASVLVFEFPIKAPEGAPTRHDMSAHDQLRNWLDLKTYYTEHNPSVTIYVNEPEWVAVGAWVYEHFDQIGGLSFLPKDGGQYELAPYEEITEEEYAKRAKALPAVDFGTLGRYEKEDMTEINREFACSGDKCEI